MSKADFGEAFGCIAFYDGHNEWLLQLAEELEKTDNYSCPFPTGMWHTEEHTLWMMLVGMFGDWGTSIRSGWIDDCKGAAEFIRDNVQMEEGDD